MWKIKKNLSQIILQFSTFTHIDAYCNQEQQEEDPPLRGARLSSKGGPLLVPRFAHPWSRLGLSLRPSVGPAPWLWLGEGSCRHTRTHTRTLRVSIFLAALPCLSQLDRRSLSSPVQLCSQLYVNVTIRTEVSANVLTRKALRSKGGWKGFFPPQWGSEKQHAEGGGGEACPTLLRAVGASSLYRLQGVNRRLNNLSLEGGCRKRRPENPSPRSEVSRAALTSSRDVAVTSLPVTHGSAHPLLPSHSAHQDRERTTNLLLSVL